MITLKLSNPKFKAMMEALRIVAYDKSRSYKERMPYLNAYLDIEYKVKREERKNNGNTSKRPAREAERKAKERN